MTTQRVAARYIADPLLVWFARHGRATLPWRSKRDPYRIVVSEFMLQQTQVERVIPIFERFIAAWPTFAALAAASQADVIRAWRGLGYNSRAVRLHRLARTVREVHGGSLPRDEAELRALPGIGAYTARAVAAFAFDADVAALDTNVRRIVHRTQLGVEWPPRASERELDALAGTLVPQGAGFAFNSALMDLGSTLCTARAPKCLLCPLLGTCATGPIDASALAMLAGRYAKRRSPQERIVFERSTRFARGRIIDRLRTLPDGERISLLNLQRELAPVLEHHDAAAIAGVVDALAREGVLEEQNGFVCLAP